MTNALITSSPYRDIIVGAIDAQVDITRVELAEMLRREHGVSFAPAGSGQPASTSVRTKALAEPCLADAELSGIASNLLCEAPVAISKPTCFAYLTLPLTKQCGAWSAEIGKVDLARFWH